MALTVTTAQVVLLLGHKWFANVNSNKEIKDIEDYKERYAKTAVKAPAGRFTRRSDFLKKREKRKRKEKKRRKKRKKEKYYLLFLLFLIFVLAFETMKSFVVWHV